MYARLLYHAAFAQVATGQKFDEGCRRPPRTVATKATACPGLAPDVGT